MLALPSTGALSVEKVVLDHDQPDAPGSIQSSLGFDPVFEM